MMACSAPCIALDGAFYDQPLTGSGQYTRGLWHALCMQARPVVLLRPGSEPVRMPDVAQQTHQEPLGKVAKVQWEQRGIVHAARQVGAQLLHVPYFAGPLRAPFPVVLTVHDVIPLVLPEYRTFAMRLYLFLAVRAARRAAAIITDSDASYRDIVRYLRIPAERVHVIPLAVDASYHASACDAALIEDLRQRFGLHGPVIFNVGGFDVRKNLLMLLEAFACALPALDPRTRLVIGGKPHSANSQRYPPLEPTIQRLGLVNHVVITGPLREEEKRALYCMSDLYVYPSIYEGFGLSPLEAMACGTPVIVANRTSLPEVVGDAGVLVEPTTEAFAREIVRLMQNTSLRRQLAERARRRAAAFTWERTAQQTWQVYERVLAAWQKGHRGT